MHDEMMTLFDDCIDRMLRLRGQLAATRRVHPGERQITVRDAIEVAEHFASEAARTICPATPPAALPAPLTASPLASPATLPSPLASPSAAPLAVPLASSSAAPLDAPSAFPLASPPVPAVARPVRSAVQQVLAATVEAAPVVDPRATMSAAR